ncbi:MAG: DUF2127 domain-containing protein [Candidatus Nanoarchaeia archaeon]|nr:DUF2127 domain-containing protein [Candidatus Nanoarchaeia archaeon]
MRNEVPIGVKIISILYYISAGFGVLFAIFLFAGFAFLSTLMPFLSVISAMGYILVIVCAVIVLAISVLSFFIARGLMKLKNWARILVLVFAGLGIVMGLYSFVSGFSFSMVIQIAVQAAIGGYLLFAKEAKRAFA